MFARVVVVRMHLDGEFVFGENELCQERKFRRVAQPRPAPFCGHLFPGRAQSAPRVRAGRDAALAPGQPRLTQRFGKFCFFREKWFQGARPPDSRSENGFEKGGLRPHDADSARFSRAARGVPKNRVSRRSPSSIRSSEVAYEIRRWPGAPNASPGTTATCAFSSNWRDNSVASFGSVLRKDATELSRQLLEKAHVAVVPGEAFGAPGHLRISYATSLERIEEGLRRLTRFFGTPRAAREKRAESAS